MKKALLAFLAMAAHLTACSTRSSDSSAEPDRARQRIADLEAEAATPSTEGEASTTTAAPTTVAPTTASPTPTLRTSEESGALMPNVVCMNLQDAQDYIQSETGVFFSLSEDATGRGRLQIIDSNWIVVGQRPSVGTPISEGDAVLSAVKIGEANDC